jgi:outer membrane protein assembly factor BamB
MRINPFNQLACGIASLICVVGSGQQRIEIEAARVVPMQIGLIDDVSVINQDNLMTGEGATLKTDPDLESILKKADRYKQDGNYSVACQLWQAVLQKSGDTLYSNDNQTYYSMIEQVERTLAALPPEGLVVYRITADAAARQMIAQAPHPFDVAALTEVIRQYFISSVGDDAAFRLACVYLDQFDFVGALRLLEKIDSQYPDLSIPRGEVLTRIALCKVLMGDAVGAELTIRRVQPTDNSSDAAMAVVKQLITQVHSGETPGFEMSQAAGFREFRVGMNLPDDFLDGDLIAAWQYYLEPQQKQKYSQIDRQGKGLLSAGDAESNGENTVNPNERELVDAWRNNAWQPASSLICDRERVVFKSPVDVSAWNTQFNENPLWRSVWMNAFDLDDASRAVEVIRANWGGRGRGPAGNSISTMGLKRPDSKESMLLFGDRIHGQMALLRDVVYAIEGSHNETVDVRPNKQQGIPWNASFRRSRSNYLTAYEANSGRVLWTLPRSLQLDTTSNASGEPIQESEFIQSGGFMGVPNQFGYTLVVPVNQGGAIYVYGLDTRQNGKTLWKTYLCDEPEAGAEPWAPITLTLDGSDLFAGTGMGVVFVLDPVTGTIRIAQRYQRFGTRNDMLRNFGWQVNRMDFDGWSEDVVIPYGRQMICFASDANRIFAIDRNSGKLIWETDMNPLGQKLDYILGIYDDKLFAAGRQTIIAFDLRGEGRMLWGGDDLFDGMQSCGRGILTSDSIYMPVNDSVWSFSLTGNKGRAQKLNAVHVSLPAGAPVGNLASDGNRLWVHQGTRVIALGKLKSVADSNPEAD